MRETVDHFQRRQKKYSNTELNVKETFLLRWSAEYKRLSTLVDLRQMPFQNLFHSRQSGPIQQFNATNTMMHIDELSTSPLQTYIPHTLADDGNITGQILI